MAVKIISPMPEKPGLTEKVKGIDEFGCQLETSVVVERPLTLFLNDQEIVTMMTVGDYPDFLAVGYLANQNMLFPDDEIVGVEYDDELELVVVRTLRKTDYELKLRKRTLTSGCAQGTMFGDLMESIEGVKLNDDARINTSWLYQLTKEINTTPSLYLAAGAIHGCVLCEKDSPLIYMEDVGRHNAVDKIAGFIRLNKIKTDNKMLYTTGRLTSEMIIKTVHMKIPILVSRSGFTAWGVELAQNTGLTLIGRARGQRFVALAGEQRIIFDSEIKSEHKVISKYNTIEDSS
jgi:FdhD protein